MADFWFFAMNRHPPLTTLGQTFAPVAKMTIVHIVLALAASQSCPLHQLDVKNAFLHGDLKEEVYIKLSTGMTTPSPNVVCKLKCSLYGLK